MVATVDPRSRRDVEEELVYFKREVPSDAGIAVSVKGGVRWKLMGSFFCYLVVAFRRH